MELAVTHRRTPIRLRLVRALIGESVALPSPLAERWPELCAVRWRRGGLPPRVGGWCLGHGSVQGITLWRTVFLAPDAPWDPALLLHELRHVEQFAASIAFPIQYVWESVTRGYSNNRFEVDANASADSRFFRHQPTHLSPGA